MLVEVIRPVIKEIVGPINFGGRAICLLLNDRRVDLLEEDVHLALRVGELSNSSMIAVRVGSLRRVLCASPAYLKTRDVPKKPADLTSHDCVGVEGVVPGTGGTNWDFGSKATSEIVPIPYRLLVNSVEAAASAAIAGAGIARVPGRR